MVIVQHCIEWTRKRADAPRVSDSLARYLARSIRAERARLGMSQAELADKLGMSKQALSTLETGVRKVYAHELPDICEALGVSLLTLLARAEPDDLRRLGL